MRVDKLYVFDKKDLKCLIGQYDEEWEVVVRVLPQFHLDSEDSYDTKYEFLLTDKRYCIYSLIIGLFESSLISVSYRVDTESDIKATLLHYAYEYVGKENALQEYRDKYYDAK